MTSMDLHVSPLGRVEGDLDVRVTIEDGVVTSAWTEAAMFRGFEIILRGKDPQAGLIVCPRICGICGGSHLYKSAYALDTAWKTHMPDNATLVRNIAVMGESGGGWSSHAEVRFLLCPMATAKSVPELSEIL